MTHTGQRWSVWFSSHAKMFALDNEGKRGGRHQVKETCFERISILWDRWIGGEGGSSEGERKVGAAWVLPVGNRSRESPS